MEQTVTTKKEQWYPNQHYTCDEYRNALMDVFRSLWFENAKTRFILIGSYRMGLKYMVGYALDNNTDEMAFISEIRDVLLKMPGCSVRKYRKESCIER
jgi:hypothetical protein